MRELSFEQLRRYKQSINQSVTQYYDKVMELCKRVDPKMSDSMKLQNLMVGVKESLRVHIVLHNPQTTESFLSYARKVEDVLAFTHVTQVSIQGEGEPNIAAIHESTTPNAFYRRRKDYASGDTQYYTTQASQSNRASIQFNKKGFSSSQARNGTSRPSWIICYTCGIPGHYARDCTRSYFE